MNDLIPTHYEIKIVPDFESFTFEGHIVIHLLSESKTSKITLNANELTIASCEILQDNDNLNLDFNKDINAEELYVDLPDNISGEFKIQIHYMGKIKENLRGLYQTKYKVGDEVRIGAVTQFQTEDARRAFPCFDEPHMRATYDIELEVDKKFTTIANTPIKSEIDLPLGKKAVSFERTPKMSSYLVFIGIAEFESIEGKLNDIVVSVITHPGLTQYGHFALDYAIKTLDYCQNYYNIPYPLTKLDLIATPEFAAGAMENWGAILFRENLLLRFPGSTRKIEEIISQVVIAHEIVHQWFGNLVSPSLWKYIWLNESFATYFGSKIVDVISPELQVWDYYVGFGTNIALIADAYIGTVPIEIQDQKKTSYNIKSIPIIYSKGGAILRQVEHFLGPESFQKGLQLYLNTHAYDVASSDDLWGALETVSEKPISNLMKSWILQTGYPVVNVNRDGNTLKFEQSRFTYLKNSDETLWMIPISIQLFANNKEQVQLSYLLEGRQGSFEIDFDFYAFKINIDHNGFFRVQYTTEDVNILGSLVKANRFSTLDSWNLENDMYALFKAGKIKYKYYLEFISNYKSETLHTSIISISEHLIILYNSADENNKGKISKIGINFHEYILNKIKYLPQDKEPFYISNMRGNLLLNASRLGSHLATEFAKKEFQLLKDGNKISPDIIDSILSIAARQTNDFQWFINKFESAQNEVEIVRYGKLMAEFSDESLIDKVLEEILFIKIPMRNRGSVINSLCKNPHASPKMWLFFIANLDNFEKLHESIQEMALNSIIVNSVDLEIKNDMKLFLKNYVKTNPLTKITVDKSFETLEINSKVKKYLSN